MFNERKITVLGIQVAVVGFTYGAFYYPDINRNAEFPCTARGFRQLHSYIRTVEFLKKLDHGTIGK